MEFKLELKTLDGKPVPLDAKFKPQQEACQSVADAMLRQHSKEKAEQQQKKQEE